MRLTDAMHAKSFGASGCLGRAACLLQPHHALLFLNTPSPTVSYVSPYRSDMYDRQNCPMLFLATLGPIDEAALRSSLLNCTPGDGAGKSRHICDFGQLQQASRYLLLVWQSLLQAHYLNISCSVP